MRFRCDRCHYVFNQQMNYCTKCGCKDFWALTDDDFSEGIRLEYMEDFILAVDLLITDKHIQTGFIFDILAACLFGSIGVLTCKKKK